MRSSFYQKGARESPPVSESSGRRRRWAAVDRRMGCGASSTAFVQLDRPAAKRYADRVAESDTHHAQSQAKDRDPVLVRLILLLTVVPLVELVILFQIKDLLDWPATLGIVVLTGVIGAWLARREGFKTLRHIQEEMLAGRPPTGAVVDGLLILVAGAVLVTPGILTDLCGFALLIPAIRRWVRGRLIEKFKKHITVIDPTNPGAPGGPFVDVPATGYDPDDVLHDQNVLGEDVLDDHR